MNKTSNFRRIQNEIKLIGEQADEYSKMFRLKCVKDNIYHWKATIYGPEESLYEGYQFKLEIKLPADYPYSPISVKFVTPIQHVNINSNGDICLDILKTSWTASQNIRSVMLSLLLLLSKPNIDDPFNSDLAELHRNDEKKYKKTIRDCCEKHAKKIE